MTILATRNLSLNPYLGDNQGNGAFAAVWMQERQPDAASSYAHHAMSKIQDILL
jgi:hypothetical protein